MTDPFLEKVDGRKLTHTYIALTLAQEVAKRYINEHCAHEELLPLRNALAVTADLLEEILEKAMPEEPFANSVPLQCSDRLM